MPYSEGESVSVSRIVAVLRAVPFERLLQIEIADDIAGDDQNVILQPLIQAAHGARTAERLLLAEVFRADTSASHRLDLFGQVHRRNGGVFKAVVGEQLQNLLVNAAMPQRKHGLWDRVGNRGKPAAPAAGQYNTVEAFVDVFHRPSVLFFDFFFTNAHVRGSFGAA